MMDLSYPKNQLTAFILSVINLLCRVTDLSFPKCLMTATGVRRLAHHLRGVKVDDKVTIEATGTWSPDAQEQTVIMKELFSDFEGKLRWDMKWFLC